MSSNRATSAPAFASNASTSTISSVIRHLAVSRTIQAPADVVYDAIADITRMGEWSPECVSCSWIDGSSTPTVGARFEGTNKNNGNEWVTQSQVRVAEPGVEFAFDCFFRDFKFSSWGYTIEAVEGGCVVTETWDDYRPEEATKASVSISGVDDRVAFNKAAMTTTLERIAAAVE